MRWAALFRAGAAAAVLLGGLLAGAPRAEPRPGDAGTPAAATTSPTTMTGSCDWKRATALVRGSLAVSVIGAVPEGASEGSQVAAHLGRLFMWDLDLRRDVVAGDGLAVLWGRSAAGDLEIGAAGYRSQKLGRLLTAYRFKADADEHPSYWDADGQEVPFRLKSSPLPKYEQITALLKDRPTHQGMDFKTPVGTEVHAPRAGLVTRVDWKLRGNGRCLEVRFDDGTLAKFLHLSQVKVRRGARVRAGQTIALTGNTGRSTAPHLHYQLGRGSRTVDPVDYHGSTRRRLAGADLAAFRAQVAALTGSCGSLSPP